MATTTVKTVGTAARQYSTGQTWEDACPANLVTNDEIWQGECYNDSEFLITAAITFAGSTQDATRYKHLTTASGQSFADHANKLTNALYYNQSYGVGIRSTTGYIAGALTLDSYSRVSKLQIKVTNSTSTSISYAAGNYVDDCILEKGGANIYHGTLYGSTGSSRVIATNTLMVLTGAGLAVNEGSTSESELHNCTLIGTGGTAIANSYSTILLKNTAVYGFTTMNSGSGTFNASSNYNSTDLAAPTNWGANSQNTKTFASQFESTTVDFRVKTGADLIGAGTRDQTFTGDLDIIGQSRSTTTPTIGAWEFISTATFIAPKPFMINQAINRSRTY